MSSKPLPFGQQQAPLAFRLRPTSLDDVVGHEEIVGAKGLLRRLLAKEPLPSLILWGPPGTGKTSLVEIICRNTKAVVGRISAVSAGVQDIRNCLADAQRARDNGRSYLLFVDEIHRFNKGQQDALLPDIESGLVTLLGATTENPAFALTRALLSRVRVIALKGLDEKALDLVIGKGLEISMALAGADSIALSEDARKTLVRFADGDARRLLSVLEVAISLITARGETKVELADLEMAMGQKTLAYDRDGDEHYDVISAFIKSMRGSDPHAALYYLARMLECGEEPRFILRRMVIFASEDIGNADPHALSLATAALQALEFLGMPEGFYALAQTATYLASAPKSNASHIAYAAALLDVKRYGSLPVPEHIRHSAKNYQYPHDHPGHFVIASYLPDKVAHSRYYVPDAIGYEKIISERLGRLWGENDDGKSESKKA
jgi:putative ATPase